MKGHWEKERAQEPFRLSAPSAIHTTKQDLVKNTIKIYIVVCIFWLVWLVCQTYKATVPCFPSLVLRAITFSILCFSCDLAGSERIKRVRAQGERLSELQHINLSLLELGWMTFIFSLFDCLSSSCASSFVGCCWTACDGNDVRWKHKQFELFKSRWPFLGVTVFSVFFLSVAKRRSATVFAFELKHIEAPRTQSFATTKATASSLRVYLNAFSCVISATQFMLFLTAAREPISPSEIRHLLGCCRIVWEETAKRVLWYD